jgi:hypothetical protein
MLFPNLWVRLRADGSRTAGQVKLAGGFKGKGDKSTRIALPGQNICRARLIAVSGADQKTWFGLTEIDGIGE